MNLSKRYFIFEIIKNSIIIHLIAFSFVIIVTGRLVENSKKEVIRIGNVFKTEVIDDNSALATEYFQMISKNINALNSIKKSDSKGLEEYLSISNLESVYIYNERNKLIYSKENNSIKYHFFRNEIKFQMLKSGHNSSFFLGDNYGVYYFRVFNLYAGKEFIGKLLVSFEVSKDKYFQFIKNSFNVDSSIFYDRTRVKTTIARHGINQKGTLLDENIYNKIYNSNNNYLNKTKILGEEYMAYYVPLMNDENNRVAFFIGKPMNSIYKEIFISTTIIIFIATFIIIIISLFAYFRIKNIYIKEIVEVDNKIQHFTRNRKLKFKYFVPLAPATNEIESLKNSFYYMEKNIVEYEKQIEYQLYHDSLTKLKNMSSLYKEYECLDFNNKEYNCSLTCKNDLCRNICFLYMVSINNINNINVKFGSSFGDQVIIEVGKLLEEFSKKNRIGIYKSIGTKFLLTLYEESTYYINELFSLFETPICVNDVKLNITVNIGVRENIEKKGSMFDLLKGVNIALNAIETENTFKVSHYDNRMLHAISELFEIENDMKLGLEREEFFLVYQPKIDIYKNKTIGFEALVRWNHPTKGYIPPNKFIEMAESTGLIISLGNYILKESLLFIKKLNSNSSFKYSVAINVSVIQLLQENFVDNIKLLIANNDIDAKYLHLEITETILIKSYDVIVEKLSSLRSIGVKIDLDDFGTGYSSLNYLKNLPIDSLKIDKSFIDSLENDNSKNLVEDIINIGKKLGLIIVAEGIETEKQLGIIKNYKCDLAQGYLFSKPLEEDSLTEFLNNQ